MAGLHNHYSIKSLKLHTNYTLLKICDVENSNKIRVKLVLTTSKHKVYNKITIKRKE